MPNLFDHILRVQPLGLDGARRAIEGPIEQYNALPGSVPVSIELPLLGAVLQSVNRLDITSDRVGVEPGAGHIDAAILQQVMTRLWEEDVERCRSNVLRLENF